MQRTKLGGSLSEQMNSVRTMGLAVDSGTAHIFDHIEVGGPMWSGQGKRWARAAVRFVTPFAGPPAVQLSIAMIDADSSKNLRLELGTEDVTCTGFTAVAHTWSDTRIGRLQVNWTAIGQRIDEVVPVWDV